VQHSSRQPADIVQRLKACTADLHEQIERRVQIFNPGFDLVSYGRLLERYYGYWAPLEERFLRVEGLDHPDLDLRKRLKAHLLEADLRVLGIEPGRVGRCTQLPRADTFARALGCLYVLEGSTLGSQLVARHVRDRFHLNDATGASFFNAYGPAVGEQWKAFRGFLRMHAEAGQFGELVGAARETFESLDCWLAR
jgi:heme oxygenase (biliverdin-IX-beta and delta-forming)